MNPTLVLIECVESEAVEQQVKHPAEFTVITTSYNEFSRGQSHVNGIRSFWSFAKRRLAKFNKLSDVSFYLQIKACEYQWNLREKDLYQESLKLLRESPIS